MARATVSTHTAVHALAATMAAYPIPKLPDTTGAIGGGGGMNGMGGSSSLSSGSNAGVTSFTYPHTSSSSFASSSPMGLGMGKLDHQTSSSSSSSSSNASFSLPSPYSTTNPVSYTFTPYTTNTTSQGTTMFPMLWASANTNRVYALDPTRALTHTAIFASDKTDTTRRLLQFTIIQV